MPYISLSPTQPKVARPPASLSWLLRVSARLHRIFMYDSYVRTESCREVTRLFRDRFHDIRAPHRDTVRKLGNRFRETGSVLDRKSQRTHHLLTEENLDEIGQTLERTPRKSLSRLSQETGVSQFSYCKFA